MRPVGAIRGAAIIVALAVATCTVSKPIERAHVADDLRSVDETKDDASMPSRPDTLFVDGPNCAAIAVESLKEAPAPTEEDVRCANWCDTEWLVGWMKSKPVVMRYRDGYGCRDYAPPIDVKLPVLKGGVDGIYTFKAMHGGWVVGQDGGEWGGRVTWVADGFDGPRVLDAGLPVVALWSPGGSGVVVFQGQAHLGSRLGALLEIDPRGPTVSSKVTLPEAVIAVDAVDGVDHAYAVLSSHIVRVDRTLQVETVADAPEGSMYPMTIVETGDDRLLVGMRHYVLEIADIHGAASSRWRSASGAPACNATCRAPP